MAFAASIDPPLNAAQKAPVRPVRAHERLDDVAWLPELGLHVGTARVGRQLLRVAIRPGPRTGAPRRPLLLFNGIGANLELAAGFMTRLGGVESVIFDVPGTGGSPARLLPYRPWVIARMAARLMTQLGYADIDVMGVSWGGGMAQQFAAQYPRRCGRLVLAATAMGSVMIPGNPKVYLNMVSPKRYVDKGFMRKIAPELYGGDVRTDPEALARHVDGLRGGGGYGYLLQLLAMAGWTSLPLLWRIRQPTLILAGSDDPLVPPVNARIMARLLPDARLQMIDCGHLFIATRAEQVAGMVAEFLDPARAVARRARLE